MGRLMDLEIYGQSFWLDYLSRNFVVSKKLENWIHDEGLKGLTSNPTIFQKAIASGSGYDEFINSQLQNHESPENILDRIMITDVKMAADALYPVYEKTNGLDGYVSLEVNPYFAKNAEKTIEEVKRLNWEAKRLNLMIKIPATKEGLIAIEESIYKGFNINITLLFSVERYKEVMNAYAQGINRRIEEDLPIKDICSVASFFVSRVDTKFDSYLGEKADSNDLAKNLVNKIGVANAKIAYHQFHEYIHSQEWQKLKIKGAQLQRLLWGSTSTKDKRLSDIHYVNELIGPDTVNTMPPKTAELFNKKGHLRPRLTEDILLAQRQVDQLSHVELDYNQLTNELLEEGLQSFTESYDKAVESIKEKSLSSSQA